MKKRTGKIEITRKPQQDHLGATQFKFNGRYYTAFGRLFVVKGRYIETDYQKCCEMKDFVLSDMNIEGLDGKLVTMTAI